MSIPSLFVFRFVSSSITFFLPLNTPAVFVVQVQVVLLHLIYKQFSSRKKVGRFILEN